MTIVLPLLLISRLMRGFIDVYELAMSLLILCCADGCEPEFIRSDLSFVAIT